MQSSASRERVRHLRAQAEVESDEVVVLAPRDFDAFYRSEFAPMVALARSICGDRAVAEELVQEAFTKAHQNWTKIADYERPGGWLRRITINLAISKRRRVGREIRALRRKAFERQPVDLNMPEHDDELWEAVRELPPRQRAAVALFYQEDRSTRDIAEILGCTVSTATSHLNQARKKLAIALREVQPEDLAPIAPSTGKAGT